MHDNRNMATDDEHLSKIIKSTAFLSNATENKAIAILDLDSRFVYVTNEFSLLLVGLSAEDLMGKSYLNFASQLGDVILESRKEDLDIISDGYTRSSLKIMEYHEGFGPRIFVKLAIKNPDTDKVIGIMIQSFNINIFNLSRHIYDKNVSTTKINEDVLGMNLSRRERQVIFLFLANFHSQDIVEIINKIEHISLSKSTVDSIFRNLFVKFNCYNRAQLYNELIKRHLNHMIPRDILKPCSIPLSRNFTI